MVVFLTTVFALTAGVQEGLAAICIVQSEAFAEASRSLVTVFAQLELYVLVPSSLDRLRLMLCPPGISTVR